MYTAITVIVVIVVAAALIDLTIWSHKYFCWSEENRKRPKQVQLDDILGTENYNGPLG